MVRDLFGTDGIRGKANKYPLTPDMMVRVGRAVGKKVKSEGTVLIGRDPRESGLMIESALVAGIVSTGANVLLSGIMPTPVVAHLISQHNADAGIMITASHNPAEDNGVKIFDKGGLKLSDDDEATIEKEIKESVESEGPVGTVTVLEDPAQDYLHKLKDAIGNRSLSGVNVILDCANGAASYLAPQVFRDLGAKVSVQANTPNGKNINLDCGALYPEKVSAAMDGHYADIGISYDGDADRVMFVDEKGRSVSGDAIMYFIALSLHKNHSLNQDTIVATDYSNLALDVQLSKEGITVERVENGDRYVWQRMVSKDLTFGGEFSGHLIFREFGTTGDGILSSLMVLDFLRSQDKKLSEVVDEFKPFPQVLIDSFVTNKIPITDLSNSTATIKKIEAQLGKTGRVFVRYSGTEKKVRVLVEGTEKEIVEKYAQEIVSAITEEIKCKQ